jgi:predicted nucleic acid-binding protein
MAYFTYDTSVLVSRKPDDLRRSTRLLLSSVALLEMIASATDDSHRRYYEDLFCEHQRNEALIVPNDADWLLASKILFWLTQRRRKTEGGKLRRLQPGASQRMALDVLLAVSARRTQAAVVTENWSDFKLIQHFCNIKLIRGSDFFR